MLKKIFYGFGGLSYSVISQTISNFFMFFATSVLGISGTLVGITIGISTIWDGVSDTLIGYLSDNHSIGKLGRRNGYMLIATFGMSIFNIALWSVPNNLSTILKFLWILISLLLLETFNTMFATPYSALGNEMAESYHDRTKINAYNIVFYLIGIIIPSVLMIIFLPNTEEYPIGQLNPNGYKKIALVSSIICLVFGLLSSILTLKSSKQDLNVKKEKFSFKNLFKNFLFSFKNKKLSKIIWGYVLTSIATVFLCSVGLHFFTYSFFYTSNQITFLLLALISGTIISQPIWVAISQKKRKKPALIIGIMLTIISVFGVILIYLFRIELYSISFVLMLILIFICGIGSGAMYGLPNSLFGDAIESISEKSGDNKNATYSGTMTFASNMANSITQLLVGILLDVIKFDSSLEIQTLGVQTGLALILFIGVQVSLILACSIFASYKEKGEKDITN
ncbi:MAG: MFS transporter [Christensenellales bacterium]